MIVTTDTIVLLTKDEIAEISKTLPIVSGTKKERAYVVTLTEDQAYQLKAIVGAMTGVNVSVPLYADLDELLVGERYKLTPHSASKAPTLERL